MLDHSFTWWPETTSPQTPTVKPQLYFPVQKKKARFMNKVVAVCSLHRYSATYGYTCCYSEIPLSPFRKAQRTDVFRAYDKKT